MYDLAMIWFSLESRQVYDTEEALPWNWESEDVALPPREFVFAFS